MKKTLLALTLISGTSAMAQITVNEAHVVSAGDMVIQSNDTIPSVSAPTTGANQTWDYSSLVEHMTDTMNFVAPGWLPNASEFPTSNIAATSNGAEIYLEKDASGLRTLGVAADFFGGGTPVVIKFDPFETIIEFPANYNDSYTNNFSQRMSFDGASVGLPVDSVVNVTHSEKNVTIDSWGSMTTPYGTFEVLGTNEMTIAIDSTWTYAFGMETLVDSGSDTTYRRSYWSNDPAAKFPVMELGLDDQGNVASATWLKQAPTAEIVICFGESQLMMFPNPATDFVMIQSDEVPVSNVSVYDMNGAEVLSHSNASTSVRIDVRNLPSGMYVIKAFAKDGSLLISEEIVKE